MLANADEKQLRKTAQTLADNKDVEKLGWLQESVSFRDDSVLSNSLAGQIEGIRTSQLTDEQRNLKGVSEADPKGCEAISIQFRKVQAW